MPQTDPFAALRALRDSLPDAPVDNTADSDGDNASAKDDAGTPAKTGKKPVLTIYFERRRGKDATIISAPQGMDDADIADLASRLKRSLATGGSVRGGEILLQGDRRSDLKRMLTAWGYVVRGNLQ